MLKKISSLILVISFVMVFSSMPVNAINVHENFTKQQNSVEVYQQEKELQSLFGQVNSTIKHIRNNIRQFFNSFFKFK